VCSSDLITQEGGGNIYTYSVLADAGDRMMKFCAWQSRDFPLC